MERWIIAENNVSNSIFNMSMIECGADDIEKKVVEMIKISTMNQGKIELIKKNALTNSILFRVRLGLNIINYRVTRAKEALKIA